MKNRLLIILTVLILCIFPTYIKAEEEETKTYTNLNISSVVTTSADMSDVKKIVVVIGINTTADDYKEERITLVKSDNYSLRMSYPSIVDAKFLYGYAIGKDDVVDKYGFVTFKDTKVYDDENSSIRIDLQISFNDMGFDGKNYRKNSEVTDEEIKERQDGVAAKDTKVTTTPTGTTTIPTSTSSTEKKIINDDTNNKKSNEVIDSVGNEKSYKALELIIVGAASLFVIVGLFVFMKYRASKKMV